MTAADAPRDAIHFDFAFDDFKGYAWDFPTLVDGQELMCRGVYRIVDSSAPPEDLRVRLARFLAGKGLDLARYRLKPFAERGFEPNQPISKPRVLLVGEAAGIDIATGEGIAQAIQYGALAGRYLARAFKRNELGFSDWLPRVRASRLGWQLRQRVWAYERFYGANRSLAEQIVQATPSGLRLGMLQFAGKSFSPVAFARAVAEVASAGAHLGPRKMLRALRRPCPADEE
jgi:flavin-dependent dehydrogenase